MGRIPEEIIEQVRERCDIVEVVQARVPQLKRAGTSFKACCPFHQEKTPSFQVHPARQIYHCFGCGAGGNVFKFVMEYDKVDFLTALRMLARQAGVTLPEPTEKRDGPRGPSKDDLWAAHEAAAKLYRDYLEKDPAAGAARAYLKQRKLDSPEAAAFGIGFAPDRPDYLLGHTDRQRFPLELLETAGLAQRNERGWYDRFRNRVMFSIRDEQGRVIGFSGRVLRAEDSPAKYINSPETPIFRKSRVLFGLNFARRPMVDRRQAVLCEGQIDVIRCHLAGLTHAVAAQGTAVTEEHARILRRYVDEAVLLLDADEAGFRAAVRTAEVLLGAGLVVRCATLPAGEDPDSLILRGGAGPIERVLAEAEDIVDFRVRMLEAAGEWGTDAGRVRAIRELTQMTRWAGDAALRERMFQRAALRLGMSPDAIRREAGALARRAPSAPPPSADRASAAASAAAAPPDPPPPLPEERAIAEALIHLPAHRTFVRDHVKAELIRHPVLARIVDWLLRPENDGRPLSALAPEDAGLSQWIAELELSHRWQHRIPARDEPDPDGDMVREVLLRLWREEFKRRRREAMDRAARGAPAERAPWAARAAELTMQIKKLERVWEEALPIIEMEML
jgi:DNA primase